MKKGEKTAQRILDIAEVKFAAKGYENTNLREIADEVGIQEPGLYRHFKGKQALYQSVLTRALNPVNSLLEGYTKEPISRERLIKMPAEVFDVFLEHPSVALLFQHALLAEKSSENPMQVWIGGFFEQAAHIMNKVPEGQVSRQVLSLQILALFNVCIGFFSAQSVLEQLPSSDKGKSELVESQKELLRGMMKNWLEG